MRFSAVNSPSPSPGHPAAPTPGQSLAAPLTPGQSLAAPLTPGQSLAAPLTPGQNSAAPLTPGQSVLAPPRIPPSHPHPLPAEWNATTAPFPRGVGIHGLIERQAQRVPTNIAVIAGEDRLTFRELSTQSNRLAGHLRSLGVTSGVAVGVCLDRSPRMLVGLLGILKAGGAYVPLDPAFPRDRLKYMLDDSGTPIILTLASLINQLPENNAQIICLDRDAVAIDAHSDAAPDHTIDDADLAYVIYTSGSTGRPKGVEVTHGGVVNYLTSINKILGIHERDAFMAVTTLSFDICGFDLFSPLSAGGKVLLIDRETATDGVRLRERLEQSDATVLQATPATWRLLIEAGWQGSAPNKDRNFMAISGGEALPRELADALLSRGVELWNLYGPTETSIYSTAHRVSPGSGAVPIGRPLDNTTLHILDADRHPVPIGDVGELYIGGAGVARGYRNRPELTAERFLPDPFSAIPGAQIYRTGDMARYRPDGVVEFLGAADHQVKIRGFRIEVEEIEANLLKQPGVRAAVVVPQEGAGGAQRLVAFIAGRPACELSISTLRQGLRTALPDYMIPAHFVTLPALPLTLNGKIDRKALPLPPWGQTAGSTYVAPADDMQRGLAEIFAKALSVPRVSAADSFFELGGDSLSSVSVAIQVKQRFNRTITLAALFQSPTVAALAATLADEAQRSASTLMILRQTGHKTPLFCLPGSGGSSLSFRNLIPHLPEDRPIYAYNTPPLDQRQTPLTTIHDYALDVLRQIRLVHPRGPFHLLGYSFGGTVAFEIAHILAQRGEPVGYIGIIDSWATGYPYKLPLIRRMFFHLHNVLRGPVGTRLPYLRQRLHNFAERVARKCRRLTRALRTNRPTQPSAQQALDDILEVAEFALRNYQPKPLNRRVDFYRVDFHPDDWPGCSFDDPHNGWRPFVTADLHLTRLPCGHDEVFAPHGLPHLAAALIAPLDSADARSS